MTALEAALNTKTKLMVLLSLLATYFIWGSTFLGIRFAIETIPPLMMASTRFLLGGFVLYFIARRIDSTPIERPRLVRAFFTGMLMTGIGNGLVTYAEQVIPSGIAALWNSAIPLWMMLFNWVAFEKKRPDVVSMSGAFIGILGVAVLVSYFSNGESGQSINREQIYALMMLLASCIAWCVGSLIQKRDPTKTQPFKISSIQMFGGGFLLMISSLAIQEPLHFHFDQVSAKSFFSMLYLSIFGSVIAFTAYSWLITQLSPEKATTYALVNPLVALALGFWLANEPLHSRVLLSAALVLLGVSLILFKDALGRLRSRIFNRFRTTNPNRPVAHSENLTSDASCDHQVHSATR